jgi:hypothetical protein
VNVGAVRTLARGTRARAGPLSHRISVFAEF